MRRLLLASAFAIAALASGAADTIGWHTVRPGETLEGITARYLGSPAAWRENWKLNPGLKNPDVLTPGQKIRVIVTRDLPASFALIRKVARHVEKKPEPQPWEPAHPGDRLAERHGVQTFAGSSAELRFQDDTILTLAERSLVFLRGAKAVTPRLDRSEIEIVDGQGDLEKPAKSTRAHDIEITVGTAVARPGAPAASARFRSEQHNAQVMSYRGATAVSAAGASVTVRQGMGVAVPEGKAPGKPEKLLAAAALKPVDTQLAHPLFAWPEVKGAATYTLEVCRDRSCAEVLARTTGVTAREWKPAEALPAGSLFWRVTARATTGLDGYPAAAALTVRLGISGAVKTDGTAAAAARVALYRDGAPIATTVTSQDGSYSFGGITAGSYAVTVDSKTAGAAGTWPEQIAGPAGALCSGRTLRAAGSCGGGRGEAADDATTLATAEHVANVTLNQWPADEVDFGFSYGAVTNTADTGQGSFRQFLANANAVAGANAMKFMPLAAAAADGWTVKPLTPLPRIVDGGTVIDGRAWNPLDSARRTHDQAAELGTVTSVGEEWIPLLNPQTPDLTFDFSAAGTGLDATAELTIRNASLRGARLNLTSTAPLLVENSVVGALLERTTPSAGLEIRGTAVLRRVLVTAMSEYGIAVRRGARLEAEHLEVSDCGYGESAGDAVLIESNGSRIGSSLFLLNTHASGLAISAGRENSIKDSTFRGNRVAVASSALANENWFHANRFEDNILAAVILSGPGMVAAPHVLRIGVLDDGSTHVSGIAPGATRVAVFSSGDDGQLQPLSAVSPAADGTFDAELPAATLVWSSPTGQP